jgi:hypothetical protein
MSDESKKRSRWWIGWALFAVFVLYPVSVGPAFWLLNKIPVAGDSLTDFVGSIYWPLFQAADKTGLNWPLWKYLSYFVDLTGL